MWGGKNRPSHFKWIGTVWRSEAKCFAVGVQHSPLALQSAHYNFRHKFVPVHPNRDTDSLYQIALEKFVFLQSLPWQTAEITGLAGNTQLCHCDRSISKKTIWGYKQLHWDLEKGNPSSLWHHLAFTDVRKMTICFAWSNHVWWLLSASPLINYKYFLCCTEYLQEGCKCIYLSLSKTADGNDPWMHVS